MELTKESKSHPLATLFRVLAHFTRVADGEESDYTFITAQQTKAEEAIRNIFGSDRVCGVASYRDLHVVLREYSPFGEEKWKQANRVLEENKGVVFRTKIREWDKFFYIYEFAFPDKEGAAEQKILWSPDPKTEFKCSLVFWLAFVFLVFAYYRGGVVMLLFAAIPVYAVNMHLHEIIRYLRKFTGQSP